jgi:hypothetical protein
MLRMFGFSNHEAFGRKASNGSLQICNWEVQSFCNEKGIKKHATTTKTKVKAFKLLYFIKIMIFNKDQTLFHVSHLGIEF